MSGKRLACLFVFAAVLLCGGQALAVDCSSCTECSADPSFVQRDARNAAMLPLLRRFASTEIEEEGLESG